MARFDVLTAADVVSLIGAATAQECRGRDLADRRRGLVASLAQLLGADAGHWAWGRGTPTAGDVAPLAILDYGYSPAQLTLMIEQALRPEAISMFQSRVMPLMNGCRHAGVTRRDIIPDSEWRDSACWQDYITQVGLDSWVHAIRYRTDATWSCLHFLRRTGREEFSDREAALVELALTGVVWLNAQAEEQAPANAAVTLTPRQRTVMLMLLDGRSRREIAQGLGLSEHTIDDHIGAVYSRFGVNSLGELVSKFLKMA